MANSLCWLVSVALLAGTGDPKEPSKEAPIKSTCYREPKMVTATYAVADLVIPINPVVMDLSRTPKTGKPEQPAQDGEELQTKEPSERPETAQAEALLKLLVRTVAPRTWQENGGSGTIEYFGLGYTIVVNQSKDVQKQIGELLANLRRQLDTQVACEFRVVSISETLIKQVRTDLGLKMDDGKEDPARNVIFLNDEQVRTFLKAMQKDVGTSITQSPKMTLFNGQKASIETTDSNDALPLNESTRKDIRFALRPTASADLRSVFLNVKASMTEEGPVARGTSPQPNRTMKLDTEFRIPDGKTAVVYWGNQVKECRREENRVPGMSNIPYINRLVKNVGYGKETRCVLLLMSPRIIVAEEEVRQVGGAKK